MEKSDTLYQADIFPKACSSERKHKYYRTCEVFHTLIESLSAAEWDRWLEIKVLPSNIGERCY